MSFMPYGGMRLGHVAAVSRVIDSRTVLLRHANWSPIGGRRGQVEDNVRAVDVSPGNDWSEVRVWFAPLSDLGTTHWPVNGFIYNEKPKNDQKPVRADRPVVLASNDFGPSRVAGLAGQQPRPSRIGADFLRGIVPEAPSGRAQPGRAPVRQRLSAPARAAERGIAAPARNSDPIGRIIASRMR